MDADPGLSDHRAAFRGEVRTWIAAAGTSRRRPTGLYVTGRLPLLVARRGGAGRAARRAPAWTPRWRRRGWLRCCAHCSRWATRSRPPTPAASGSSGRCRAACCSGSPHRPSCGCATPDRGRLRGRVRDAWQPTAGAAAAHRRISIPPARAASCRSRSAPPPRRAQLRASWWSARTVRCGSQDASRASTRSAPSGCCRRSRRGGTCLPVSRGSARARRQHQRAGARAGHRVRQPPRVRRAATTSARSTGGRPPALDDVLRTWRPERDRHVVIVVDTGRTAAARVGDGCEWMPRWRRRCCSPRSPPGRATTRTCSCSTASSARGCTRVDGAGAAAGTGGRHGARRAAAHRHRLGRRVRAGPRADVAPFAAWCCSLRRTPPRRPADSSARCPDWRGARA